MQTTNAICQRRGHIDSGKRHASGLPICATCGQPFDDEDGTPALIVNTFPDPNGPAFCQRLFAPKNPPKPRGMNADEATEILRTLNQLQQKLKRTILFSIELI